MQTLTKVPRHLAALALAAVVAVALGCSSSSSRSSPPLGGGASPTVDSATEPTLKTLGPRRDAIPTTTTTTTSTTTTTTTTPTTTTPTSTTTGVADSTVPGSTVPASVPVTIAADRQPETITEGQMLMSMTPVTPTSGQFAVYPAIVESALYAVLDGTIPASDFFAAVGLQIPDGAVVGPYLVCPIAIGPPCRADQTDYLGYMSECTSADTEVFTSWAQSNGTWAAAGVCAWVPSGEQVASLSSQLAEMMVIALTERGVDAVRDPRLDAVSSEMARLAGEQVVIGGGEDFSLFSRASEGLLDFGAHRGWVPLHVYGQGTIETGEAARTIDQWLTGEDFTGWSDVRVGVGAAVIHGRMQVYVTYAG